MGTRGYLGIRKKGELKGHYNHFDSYVSYLGRNIIETINDNIEKYGYRKLLEKLNKTYDNIILVDDNNKPTQEQIEKCVANGLYNKMVSTQSKEDWYCLLRNAQGNLQLYLNGFDLMLNGNDFINDKVFCEYAYIIDLDKNKLDIIRYDKNLCSVGLDELNYDEIVKLDD